MLTQSADTDSPAGMLVFARARRAAAEKAEGQVFQVAAAWAAAHSGDSLQPAHWWENGADTGLSIAGEGAPLVSEFAVIEFSAALGLSTDAGRTLIAHAVEVRYRLPKLWRAVTEGAVPVWRVRRVATATLGLGREAARFVDDQVWIVAHRVGPAQLDRLVADAKARFQPAETAAERDARADRRHVTIFDDQVSVWGTMRLEADLDLADALAFDKAVAEGAAARAALGSTESLDVRRAAAVGDLARTQLSLDLATTTVGAQTDSIETDPTTRPEPAPTARWCSTSTLPRRLFRVEGNCLAGAKTPAHRSPSNRFAPGVAIGRRSVFVR